jgi:cbb3-type cytochrome oxidase maturation protein
VLRKVFLQPLYRLNLSKFVILVYILIFGVMMGFGVSALYGIFWAAKSGQFSDLQKGGESIFDQDEPLGVVTDAFPGQGPAAYQQKKRKC